MGCTPKRAQEGSVSSSCRLRFLRELGPLSDVASSRTEPSASWSEGSKARRQPRRGGAKIPRPRQRPLSGPLPLGSVLLPAARPPAGGTRTSKFSFGLGEVRRARSAPRPPTPVGPAAAAGQGDRRGGCLPLRHCGTLRQWKLKRQPQLPTEPPWGPGQFAPLSFWLPFGAFSGLSIPAVSLLTGAFLGLTALVGTPEGHEQRPYEGLRPGDRQPPLGPADPILPHLWGLWALALGCARPFLVLSAPFSPPRWGHLRRCLPTSDWW